MHSITVGIREGRVVLYVREAKLAVAFSWRAALDVARATMWKARGLLAADPDRVATVRIRRTTSEVSGQPDEILVEEIVSGRLLFVAPLAAAHAVGEALIATARELETAEKAASVVYDQAILQRLGMRFGVTSDPAMQAEAMKEAHWNTGLRRYLPRGVRSQEIVGVPTLSKQQPTATAIATGRSGQAGLVAVAVAVPVERNPNG